MLFTTSSIFAVLIIGFVFFRAVYADRSPRIDNVTADVKIYRDQLEEVERDLERGLLTEDQAESVRTEVSRRLLSANSSPLRDQVQSSEGRPWLLAGMVCCIAIGAPALYLSLGSFGASDLPIASRIASLEDARASRPSQIEAEQIAIPLLPSPQATSPEHEAMVQQLRSVVADRPGDIQGLRLLARQEVLLGNYVAAREALEQIVLAQKDAPAIDDLAALFDTMLFNANDYISPEAERVLSQLRERAPDLLLGQFYEGMLEIQSGRSDRAFPIWRNLVEDSPADAPWVEFVRGEMPGVAAAAGVKYTLPPLQEAPSGPTSQDIAAAAEMSADDRQQMVEGMVSQLSDRLANEGGSAEDWGRLIRALVVLDRTERARDIFAEAQLAFQSDPSATDLLNQLAAELGIN